MIPREMEVARSVFPCSGFLRNEANPVFDAYLVGDLPVFCQGSMKMLQVIFIPVRIHCGFSSYIVTVGQARVTLTFHPPPRLLSCLSDISDFPQT